MTTFLKAPFPWFGGKSQVAHIVWSRLGDVQNYVEPFFGSGAVLLSRPHEPKIETVNDKDHFVSNFWRSVKCDPDAVAHHADWPVNEADLEARHDWLVTVGRDRLTVIEGDPNLYDAQVAGWWMWGMCLWIGSGFCSGDGPWQWSDESGWINLGSDGQGIKRQRPHLSGGGQGINRQLPHLGNGGRIEFIRSWMRVLCERLRDVRVCAGDWSRVCTKTPTYNLGTTGIFLDPPYADTASRTPDLYRSDSLTVAHDVRRWAVENGDNPLMRICLAGYDNEHDMPTEWECVHWKANGGYSGQSDEGSVSRDNAGRERLWFSPHCLQVETVAPTFFQWMESAQ